MNTFLVILNAAGSLSVAVAALRYYETRLSAPILFRGILLALAGAGVYAAIECMAWPEPMRPGAVALVVITGVMALRLAFVPAGVSTIKWIGDACRGGVTR